MVEAFRFSLPVSKWHSRKLPHFCRNEGHTLEESASSPPRILHLLLANHERLGGTWGFCKRPRITLFLINQGGEILAPTFCCGYCEQLWPRGWETPLHHSLSGGTQSYPCQWWHQWLRVEKKTFLTWRSGLGIPQTLRTLTRRGCIFIIDSHGNLCY